ncbi:unnamed protein product [Closterium sp. NIES-54]
MKSKKCNLGGTSKLGEHEESGAAFQKKHKGEENPKAAAEEEYGENMWGTIASAAFSNLTSATGECDWLTLHRRMGHVALPILQQLVKNEMVAGIRVKGEPDEVLGSPTCMQAKFTRYPFSSSEATAKAPLDEVVMDLVGPLKLGAAGAEYFLTIVDVYTRMTWVYVLSKKSDVAETVKTDWLPMVERQQDRLPTNGGACGPTGVCEGTSVGEEERCRFHSLVGSLVYAAVNTRPDVAFATEQLPRVVQCPNEEQVAAGMRVAKYLGQTPTVGLQYSAAAQRRQKGVDGIEPGRLFLTAFSDASFASEPEDMTSVGGFICCVGGGPTAWESKKQVDQSLSSVESEYMALFRAVREIVWQRRLLAELGEEQQGPTPLYCDSQGAIALAKNPVLHGLTKHMRVKWHWTRSMVAAGEVELHFVKTTRQPADMMTKMLLASPLLAPSPYTEQIGGLTECCAPASRLASPVRPGRHVPRPRPPPIPGTHAMTLRPSSIPLRVPLPAPPDSSLPGIPDPESDRVRATRPIVSRLLATALTDPSFETAAVCALVAQLLDFAAASRLDYTTALVAESTCASHPSVGDPDASDIPTPRSYAEATTSPYSSQWQAAMDAEMASWKSTGTYVNEVPLLGANIVDGMWIFRVKRPTGSPPVFKARYHSFLQGSLHEEIWLRRPPGFTGSFLAGTQWSLRWLVHGLRQAPCEWHDTQRTTLAALGFAPSTADPLLFLLTDSSLPPFYVLVYVDALVFASPDTEALTLVKCQLQKRHTCTDLSELRSCLGLQITRDRARRTITLTQSHMVQQVLQRFGFQFSSPQPTPLSTSHLLSAPPSDEFVEPSGQYPELVGYLMYLMTCTRPDLAYPLSLLACYVAPGRHQKVHWDAAMRLLCYLCSTSGMGLVLGGRGPVVLTCHADASSVDDSATHRSSQGYTFSFGSGSDSWRSTRSSSVLSSSCEAEIYAGAMAAQELR